MAQVSIRGYLTPAAEWTRERIVGYTGTEVRTTDGEVFRLCLDTQTHLPFVDIPDPASPRELPSEVMAAIECFTLEGVIGVSPQRDRGIYRLGTAEVWLTESTNSYCRLEGHSTNLDDLQTLFLEIRTGAIYPDESFETNQGLGVVPTYRELQCALSRARKESRDLKERLAAAEEKNNHKSWFYRLLAWCRPSKKSGEENSAPAENEQPPTNEVPEPEVEAETPAADETPAGTEEPALSDGVDDSSPAGSK